jgi:hypothetical protein
MVRSGSGMSCVGVLGPVDIRQKRYLCGVDGAFTRENADGNGTRACRGSIEFGSPSQDALER